MPRQSRINVPGALHHIMVRGINGQRIFRDNKDRSEFIVRLEKSLKKSGCGCYAWSLMPNHYHLLIQSGSEGISGLMRVLQTGYAVYFNRRHKRRGYLFQNRYKSVLCQEEPYFLELVRYVHLNPLRGKVVRDLKELERYEWSGHGEILKGNGKSWQGVGEVLGRFGKRVSDARKRYREFVREGVGVELDRRLEGGGLVRSMGSWRSVLDNRRRGIRWMSDERILGDDGFVNEVLSQADEKLEKQEKMRRAGWDMDRLAEAVAEFFEIEKEDLSSKGRNRRMALARAVFAYYACEELGETGVSVATVLGLSRTAVTKAIVRGKPYAGKIQIS
ncbi:MAG: transposase [Chlamydiota bacterium]|nr:transposase [Chlamydiota bacterium]